MKFEEMKDFAAEQLEIFGEGSQMNEFNAYSIAEEMKRLKGE